MNCEALETEKSEPAGNGVEENGSDRDTLHADADVVDPDIKTAECAQGAGDANASVLEAQDVTPEAIRRGRMVVGLILVLFAAAIVVLVVMPPLSWKPPKKVKQNFASLASAELVEAGQGEMRSLAYAPMGEHVFYRLSLEQDTSYAQGNQMSSKLEGRLEIFRPKRQDLADTVGLKLHDARTFVKDGDKQIEMGESAEMLGGVSLFTRLDAQDGMGLAVPESNVNPQVARVMYVLTDALRDIWIPLPKTDVGAGGSWTVTDVWDKSETYKRRAVSGLQF